MPPVPANPAVDDEEEAPVPPQPRTGTTGGAIPDQASDVAARQPVQWSADPAQRQAQIADEIAKRRTQRFQQEHPFTPSSWQPKPPVDAQGNEIATREDRQFTAQAEDQAQFQQQQGRAREIEKRRQQIEAQKTSNDQLEAQYRGSGQQFYTDAHGRIQPVIETGTNRPLFNKTGWQPTTHPETGKPTLMMRDQYGQRQFKEAPVVPSLDPADDQMYYKMPDGTLSPAGSIDEFAKHPNYQVAKTALAAKTRQVKEIHRQALQPIKLLADQAGAQLEDAKTQVQSLDSDIEKTNTAIANAVGADGSPTPLSEGLSASLQQMQQQREALDAQTKPRGDLARKAARARAAYTIASATAMREAFAAQHEEIAARVKAQGGKLENDPTYQANARGMQQADQILQQANTSFDGTEEKLPGPSTQPTATQTQPGVLEQSEPFAAAQKGVTHIGAVPLKEFARRYGDGTGAVQPDSLVKLYQRSKDIDATLTNSGTTVNQTLRDNLQKEKDYVEALAKQRFARLPEDQQKRVAEVTRDSNFWDVTKGSAKSVAEGAAVGGGSFLKGLDVYSPSESDRRSAEKFKALLTGKPVDTADASKRMEKIRNSPAYKLGSFIQDAAHESYSKNQHEDEGMVSKAINAASEAAGGFAPIVASGHMAPMTAALQSAGEQMDQIYADQIKKGATKDQAAKFAVDRAQATGVVQGALFAVLPKPLQKAGSRLIVDKIAGDGLMKFFANRVAQAGEGAVIGGVTKAAENITTDRPIGEGVPAAAAGMAAAQTVMPRATEPPKNKGGTPANKPAPKPTLTPEQQAAEAEFQKRLNEPAAEEKPAPKSAAESAEVFAKTDTKKSAADSAEVFQQKEEQAKKDEEAYQKSPLTVDPERHIKELKDDLKRLDTEWESHKDVLAKNAEYMAEHASPADVHDSMIAEDKKRHEALSERRDAIEQQLTEAERLRQSPKGGEELNKDLAKQEGRPPPPEEPGATAAEKTAPTEPPAGGAKSDYDRYQEIHKQWKDVIKRGEMDSPEIAALWKENETIKNRHGGMPPEKPAEVAQKSSKEMLDNIMAKNPNADPEATKMLLGKKKYEVRDIPISEIGEVFGSKTVQPEVVKKYEATKSDEPIVLGKVEGSTDTKLRPIDGKHRLTAAINRGDKTIKAYVPVDEAAGKTKSEEPSNAVQKQSPSSLPVRETPAGGEGIRVENTVDKGAAAARETKAQNPAPVPEKVSPAERVKALAAGAEKTIAKIQGPEKKPAEIAATAAKAASTAVRTVEGIRAERANRVKEIAKAATSTASLPERVAEEVSPKLPKDAAPVSADIKGHTPETVEGDKLNKNWTAFGKESGTLGVPRAEMPQVKSEARGALVNFLRARNMPAKAVMVKPSDLKPTQAEFSPQKVQAAREFSGSERPVLISSDNHLVDGHHQWMAGLQDDPKTPMPAIKIDAPIDKVLAEMKEFPSTETKPGIAAKAATKEPSVTAPATQRLSDRAIAALQKAKIETRGRLFDVTGGAYVIAHNSALDLAILGIRAGRALNDVVKLAVARFKAKFPDHTPEHIEKLENDIRAAAAPAAEEQKPAEAVANVLAKKPAAPRASIAQAWKKAAGERDLKKTLAATRDAADNLAATTSDEAHSSVVNEIDRQIPKDERGVASDALAFHIEAGEGGVNALEAMREKIDSSDKASPKWKERAITAIDYAIKNHEKLKSTSDLYREFTDKQVEQEQAAGMPTLKRDNYVMHAQDVEDGGWLSGGGGMSPTGASSRKNRTFDTFADSIAAGIDPKSLNAPDLLRSRVRAGQTGINLRQWQDSLKDYVDPSTKQPIATKPERVDRADGSFYYQAPKGYENEMLNGTPVSVKKEYAGTVGALTDPSWWSKTEGRRVVQKLNGAGKSINLLIDTFHLGRLALRQSILKTASLTDPHLPIPSYTEGKTILEHSPEELTKMAKNGEIDAAALPDLLEKKKNLTVLTKAGLNIGHVADSLHQEMIQKIPVLGEINKFIFEKFQRGAMSEAALMEFDRQSKSYPELTPVEVARKVASDLNTRFGNLGRQGIFKSRTAQDIARLIWLAPQWNEGLIRSELGGVGQIGKSVADAVTGKRIAMGALGRDMIAGTVGIFVANQIINQMTRGKFTWENPEEGWGSKLSAWIPDKVGGKSSGFFLNPLGVTAEISHLLLNSYERKGSGWDAMKDFAKSRSSAVARPVMTWLTGKDALGGNIRTGDMGKEVLKSAAPVPIGGSAVVSALRGLKNGGNTETYPGQFQKQLMQTGGLKTDTAPSPEQRIQDLAKKFKSSKGIEPSAEFYAGDYSDLTNALRRNNPKDIALEIQDLLKKKTIDEIKKHYQSWGKTPFTGQRSREAEFIKTLSPEQRAAYTKAQQERLAIGSRAISTLSRTQPIIKR